MLCRTALAVSAMLLLATSLATPLRAKDCPVQEFSHEAREDAIRKAPTCKRALEIMTACSYGAGGDIGLGAAVRERCEPDFLPKLRTAQKRAYDREQRRCVRKYARQSGTMYRSFTAFCQAKSTVAHAGRFGAIVRVRW
jgi:hypothetical protein